MVRIGELDSATEIYDNDKLVVEQNGQAMALPGSVFREWLNSKIDGSGGIQSITGPVHRDGKDYYTISWTKETKPEQEFYITSAAVETFKVDYAASESGTQHPADSAFKDNLGDVTVGEGEYLWTRTRVKWNSGSVETAYSVGYYGRNGEGSGTVTSVNGISPDTTTGDVKFSYEKKHYFSTVSFTAPGFSSAFFSDSTYDDYPFRLDIPLTGMTASHHAELIFTLNAALLVAPVCNTATGKVSTWFMEKPDSDFSVTIEYWK